MTTSFRRSHPVVAGLAAALALAACGQGGSAAGGASPRQSASAAPQAVRTLEACFGTAPAGWTGTPRASLPTTKFEPEAVSASGDRVYGSYLTTAGEMGIAAVDLANGTLRPVYTAPPGLAGAGGVAAVAPWVAWVRNTSSSTTGPWALEARNVDTGEQVTVATGAPGLVKPAGLAMRGTDLAWTQPTSIDLTAPAGEVRVMDLAARRQTVLDTGVVGPPVFAGPYLVWTRAAAAGGSAVLQAVDAGTLLPAALPERVRTQTGVTELAGSASYLFWDTDAQHGTAWRIDSGQLTTYSVDGTQHRLQFFSLAGHYLLWFESSGPGLVMDLDSGGGYEMPGSFAGSEAAMVRAAPLGPSNPKSGSDGTTLQVLATSNAPAIPGCRQ